MADKNLKPMNLSSSERFAVLWTKAQPTVSAFVSSLVPNFHQAEDVLDQVVVTLMRKFDQYDQDRPFVNWSIGIAKFEVLKHRRTMARDRHVFCDELVQDISEEYEEMSLELDHRRQVLTQCLDQVEGRGKKALQLRYFDDLKPAEIAERMRMAAGAVRVMLHRVRAAIRKCMERRNGELRAE
jgi:RNA polymerase sigma-70 factor (ECF subfamily)